MIGSDIGVLPYRSGGRRRLLLIWLSVELPTWGVVRVATWRAKHPVVTIGVAAGTSRLIAEEAPREQALQPRYLDGHSLTTVADEFKIHARTLAREFRKARVTIRPRRGWTY
jgi:hypothetical protein